MTARISMLPDSKPTASQCCWLFCPFLVVGAKASERIAVLKGGRLKMAPAGNPPEAQQPAIQILYRATSNPCPCDLHITGPVINNRVISKVLTTPTRPELSRIEIQLQLECLVGSLYKQHSATEWPQLHCPSWHNSTWKSRVLTDVPSASAKAQHFKTPSLAPVAKKVPSAEHATLQMILACALATLPARANGCASSATSKQSLHR